MRGRSNMAPSHGILFEVVFSSFLSRNGFDCPKLITLGRGQRTSLRSLRRNKTHLSGFRLGHPLREREMRAALYTCIVISLFASSAAIAESGIASVYGLSDGHASGRTASGERMNPTALVAAHRTLPFGTRVTVSRSGNGKSVVVRIIDRGPFIRGRVVT